jgi:GNAT superfamily N-acetyltransferase
MSTYYLEMTSKNELLKKCCADSEFTIAEMEIKQWEVNKFLYGFIGKQWLWRDKLCWSDEQWNVYTHDENLKTFIGFKKASIVGYYELKKEKDDVEIAYFGLAPQFIGKGYGGHLLSDCIEQAWLWGAKRVWVHTCDLDHSNALKNYQARGMKIYKTIPENV